MAPLATLAEAAQIVADLSYSDEAPAPGMGAEMLMLTGTTGKAKATLRGLTLWQNLSPRRILLGWREHGE